MNSCAACWRDADVLRQRERALAVQQRVVDHLRDAAQVVRVPAAVGAEDLHRGPLVEIDALAERVDEHRLLGEMREHAELDLRVVGRNQHVAGIGDERAADLAAERRADRDVLQVRIAAAQAAGGGDRLVEAGVHAAGLGIHELRQRVDVGALQLHQLAPLENLARDVVASAPAPRALRPPSTAPSTSRSASAPAAAACRTALRPAASAS